MTAEEPSDPNAPRRRTVLRWLAALPGVAAIGLQPGCSSEGGSGSESNGTEGGDPPDAATESGGEDITPPEDSGETGDTEETGADASEPDASQPDASQPDTSQPDTSQPDTVADAGEPPVDADIPPEVPAPDPCEVTGSDVLGPFHEPGAPMTMVLAGPEEPGDRILISGRVYGPSCDAPLAGVLLDVWQADANGAYHDAGNGVYRLRGQMLTDDEGRYSFESIRPGNYPLGGSWRPAHIHFNVSAPGLVPLTTQLYFEDDPYLAPNDACGSCNSWDATHIVPMTEETNEGGDTVQAGWFDIVLGGSGYR